MGGTRVDRCGLVMSRCPYTHSTPACSQTSGHQHATLLPLRRCNPRRGIGILASSGNPLRRPATLMGAAVYTFSLLLRPLAARITGPHHRLQGDPGMSNARSPLGDLVVFHRSRQGYTRTRLADRGIELSAKGLIDTPVSSRTLGRIERITTPDQWHRPHIQSVIALAAMLDLTPGTPEHDAFIDAGLNLSASTVNSPDDTSPQRADHASQGHNFVIAGRKHQLERISAVIDAAANGRSSVAGISGNPGIGKTSIIAEACRRALARHEDLTLYWTAVHYRPGPPLPWEPFRELLSQMLGDFSTIPDALHVPRSDSQHRSDRITEAVRRRQGVS